MRYACGTRSCSGLEITLPNPHIHIGLQVLRVRSSLVVDFKIRLIQTIAANG